MLLPRMVDETKWIIGDQLPHVKRDFYVFLNEYSMTPLQ